MSNSELVGIALIVVGYMTNSLEQNPS
jgi:hypothetical protein